MVDIVYVNDFDFHDINRIHGNTSFQGDYTTDERETAMGKLERCPFCGDIGRKVFNVGQYGAFGYIECDLCGAKTKSAKLISPKMFESEEAFWTQRAWEPVIRNWNRRYEAQESA